MAASAPRMFALIQHGLVHELIHAEGAIGDLFHAGLTLIEAPDTVCVGWQWTQRGFAPPDPVTAVSPAPSPIDQLRAELRDLRLRLDKLGGA